MYSAFFVAKSGARSKRGWALFLIICSKWQPLYFVIVSAQRVILSALALSLVLSNACNNTIVGLIAASELVWTCTIIVAGMSTIFHDLDTDFTPLLRRSAYCFFAFCLIVDLTGSFLWGPAVLRTQVYVGNLKFVAENGTRSCITSQLVIALHFLFVSYRSRNGRGWAYASLRFMLDESVTVLNDYSMQSISTTPNTSTQLGLYPSECAGGPASGPGSESQVLDEEALQSSGATESDVGAILRSSLSFILEPRISDSMPDEASQRSGTCFSIRRRFMRLQRKLSSQCRVFVVPCVAINGAKEGYGPRLEIAQPFFKLGCLKPLQWLAEAHPMIYLCFGFLVAVLSFVLALVLQNFQIQGIATLTVNSTVFIILLGFFSSPRYNFDKVAAKHVAASFRYATFVVLHAMFIALESRRAYLGIASPSQTLALAMLSLIFCLCLLIDCAPQFSAMFQIWVSVTAHSQCR
jgi:hypothetical protein